MSTVHGHIGRLTTVVGSSFLAIGLLLGAGLCAIAGQTDSAQTESAPAVEAHFAAAQQAQKNNDYVTAEREYRAVLAIRPDFAEVHMNLGLVYQLHNQLSDARTAF